MCVQNVSLYTTYIDIRVHTIYFIWSWRTQNCQRIGNFLFQSGNEWNVKNTDNNNGTQGPNRLPTTTAYRYDQHFVLLLDSKFRLGIEFSWQCCCYYCLTTLICIICHVLRTLMPRILLHYIIYIILSWNGEIKPFEHLVRIVFLCSDCHAYTSISAYIIIIHIRIIKYTSIHILRISMMYSYAYK